MKTRWFYSLATKTTVLVALGTSLVLAAVLTYSYISSRDIIEDQAEQSLLNLAKSEAAKLELKLSSVAEVAGNLAVILETDRLDKVTLNALIRRNVQDHPAVFGSAVAFEPFSFISGVKAYAPYFLRGKTALSISQVTPTTISGTTGTSFRENLESPFGVPRTSMRVAAMWS